MKSIKKTWLSLVLVFSMVLSISVCEKAIAADTTQKTLAVNTAYTEVWQEYETKLFKFTVPQAGLIDITIKNTNPIGTEEVAASLFDANNAQVISKHDGANVTLPTYSTNAGATYYLKVEDDYAAWKSSFTVYIKFTATANWETEKNDTASTADVITAKKTYYGMINSDYDACDYYKFSVPGNKKVTFKFGPAAVDGENRQWRVYVVNSKNQSAEIMTTGTTQTTTMYLKKGTYYLKVENNYSAKDVRYFLVYSMSNLKIKKPKITSIKLTGHDSWFFSDYVTIDRIKIKNSGTCAAYNVKVAKTKKMKGKLANESITFGDRASLKRVVLSTSMQVVRRYYVQLRGYVTDPFGKNIYGKFSKVKCATLKKSVYKKLK